MTIILFLLGVAGIIVNANGWFVIPSIAIILLFAISGFLFVYNFIAYKKTEKEIRRRFRD